MMNKIKFLLLVCTFFILSSGCSKKVLVQELFESTTPDNIILMIGDGMGLSHITAHIYQHNRSILQDIVDVGLVMTHSADNLVTDSGAGATAMATGQKVKNNHISRDQEQDLETIVERANKFGISTGIVTTASLLDATPAAFYAHSNNRYYLDSISRDLVNSNVDVLIGGGKQFFDGTMEGSPYSILDFENRNFFVSDIWRIPIQRLGFSVNKKLLYFNGIESASLHVLGFDFLKQCSKKAIDYLSQKHGRFFLMIEGAQIDWASHAGRQEEVLYRMEGFEMAVEEVLRFAQKDKHTLVLITADHTTGGLTIIDGSKPGDVKLNFSTNGHTGSMVPIFAYGPGADLFRGVIDNTDIYRKMSMLLNLTSIPQPPVTVK